MSLAYAKAHLSELVGAAWIGSDDRVTVTGSRAGRPAVSCPGRPTKLLEETIAILLDAEVVRQLTSSDAELARR